MKEVLDTPRVGLTQELNHSGTVDESFPRIFMVLWRARHPVARARGCLAWQMWIQHADRIEEKKHLTLEFG